MSEFLAFISEIVTSVFIAIDAVAVKRTLAVNLIVWVLAVKFFSQYIKFCVNSLVQNFPSLLQDILLAMASRFLDLRRHRSSALGVH